MVLRRMLCTTLLAFLPSVSQALTLECSLPAVASGGGYVTEKYFFEFDEATGKALASDGVILYYHDGPIEAKVSDNSAKKLALSWTVQMTNSTGQITKMLYRASYFKTTNKVTIRAVPSGYSNDFEARGTCKAL